MLRVVVVWVIDVAVAVIDVDVGIVVVVAEILVLVTETVEVTNGLKAALATLRHATSPIMAESKSRDEVSRRGLLISLSL